MMGVLIQFIKRDSEIEHPLFQWSCWSMQVFECLGGLVHCLQVYVLDDGGNGEFLVDIHDITPPPD
jgi:hypothetical protein